MKIIYKLKNLFGTTRDWIHNCMNKKHFAVVKQAFCGYPYDYAYLLRLEKKKIEEMIHYHENSNILIDSERDYILFWMRISVKLLSILLDEVEIVKYDGKLKFIEDETDDNKSFLVDRSGIRRKILVNVNLQNKRRFMLNGMDEDFFDKFPDELYIRKAKHLYYRIREAYTESWWD